MTTNTKTTAHFRKKWAVDFCCLSKANLFNFMDEVEISVSAEPGITENGVTFTVTPFFAAQ